MGLSRDNYARPIDRTLLHYQTAGGKKLRSRDMKKFRSVDEVLDFAINREIDAQKFYMELADFVEKPEMAKVLSDLASEEVEHKEKLEAVKSLSE